jgi:hypothetical protein
MHFLNNLKFIIFYFQDMVATRQSSGHAGISDGPSTSGSDGRSKAEVPSSSNKSLVDLPPELLDKIFSNFKYKQISQLRKVRKNYMPPKMFTALSSLDNNSGKNIFFVITLRSTHIQ